MTPSSGSIVSPSVSRGIPLAEEAGIGALTLGGYLREIAARYGPRDAAVLRLGGSVEAWTYKELLHRSEEIACSLIACGIGKGERVGVLATNRPEFLACVFGTALAGGVAAPLSTFSTPAELELLLQQSCISVLLFERHVLAKDFQKIVLELEPQIDTAIAGGLKSEKFPFLRRLVVIGNEAGLGAIEGWADFLTRGKVITPERVTARAQAVAPSDPGALFFSSGSTGKPKGILSAHRGVCLQLWRWKQWHDLPQPPRTWSSNGFFWSGNFAMALGGTLSAGGTLILQRWFDPEEALTLLQEEQATMLLGWPHQWAQLEASPNWVSADLSKLKYVSCLTPITSHPTIQSDWAEPRHAYGNTETFTLITAYPANMPEDLTANSHGIPTAGATIKIVDPLTGMIVPTGTRGEIAVKGPTLMLGYLGIPLDQTLDAEGFFRTGDSGYIDAEGRMFWEGRLNDIIKTGGANVSPVEIDIVLSQCPGVKISQTVGVPDDLLGELVVACIVPHEDARLDEESVRRFARQTLAAYKVPRRVLFCTDDDLTLTGSAKIKAADLREFARQRLASKPDGQIQ